MWDSIIQPGVALAIAIGLGREVRVMRKAMETGLADVSARFSSLEGRVTELEKPKNGPAVRGFGARAMGTLGILALFMGCQVAGRTVEAPKAVQPRDATVFIHMTDPDPIFGGEGYATGWYIASDSERSVIATAGHVCDAGLVYGVSQVVSLEDDYEAVEEEAYAFYDIDEAPSTDVCLLVVNHPAPAVLPIAEVEPTADAPVHYTGYPSGTRGSYTGTVENVNPETGTILLNIPGFFGASGSAVLNGDGEVVGVLSMGDMRFPHHVWLTGTFSMTLAKIAADEHLWSY